LTQYPLCPIIQPQFSIPYGFGLQNNGNATAQLNTLKINWDFKNQTTKAAAALVTLERNLSRS